MGPFGKHRYPRIRHTILSCIFIVGGKGIVCCGWSLVTMKFAEQDWRLTRIRHDSNLEVRPLKVFHHYVWSEAFQGLGAHEGMDNNS